MTRLCPAGARLRSKAPLGFPITMPNDPKPRRIRAQTQRLGVENPPTVQKKRL